MSDRYEIPQEWTDSHHGAFTTEDIRRAYAIGYADAIESSRHPKGFPGPRVPAPHDMTVDVGEALTERGLLTP